MKELTPIWKDGGICKEVKICVFGALVWPVLMYGAEGWKWTIKKENARAIEATEMRCYRRLLRVCWTEMRLQRQYSNET